MSPSFGSGLLTSVAEAPTDELAFWRGKSVAVPGGAGFVGSHLVELLVGAGAEVTVIDNFARGRVENLEAVLADIRLIEGDAGDPHLCLRAFRGKDAILNLAGIAPGIATDDGVHSRLFQENVRLGAAILAAAHRADVERVLLVSSSCVYPDNARVPTPELSVVNGAPESANHGYGWAKRHLELLAGHYAEKTGMRIAIARPSNAYGARDFHTGEGAHAIPALVGRLLSPDPVLTVWGSGNQSRSFIHATDAARALALLTEHHACCEPVNVGVDAEISMRELAEAIMRLCDVSKPLVFDTSRPEGATRKLLDVQRLSEVVGGFTPLMDFEEGLFEVIEAFRAKRSSPIPATLEWA